MSFFVVRPERPADRDAVYRVEQSAFGRDGEAQLVENLRRDGACLLSLVAECENEIVGHILFTPAIVRGAQEWMISSLGPLAVAPEFQKRGVGSQLVRDGLAQLLQTGQGAVLVLGHAGYYARFGFSPASRWGIKAPFEVPDEAFMILELRPGALQGIGGIVSYPPAFDAL